jgi:hypothetical protein
LSEASEGPGSQGRSSAFTEAPEKSFRCTLRTRFRAETVTLRATCTGVPDRSAFDLVGWSVEAEERAAAGRRFCPDAVTEDRAGCETADALRTKVTHPIPAQEARQNCQPETLR